MNKKVLLSLLLVPFLASCGGQRQVKTLRQLQEQVNKFEDNSDIEYVTALSKGNFFGLKVDLDYDYDEESRITPFGSELEDYKRDDNGNLVYDKDTNQPVLKRLDNDKKGYGKSLHLYAPLFINPYEFIDYDETGALNPKCQYRIIKDLIVDFNGSNAVFEAEFLKDGGIRFFATKSNMYTIFYHIDEYNEGVSAGARWDLSLTYNKKGCLVKETIKTSFEDIPNNSCDITANYTHE